MVPLQTLHSRETQISQHHEDQSGLQAHNEQSNSPPLKLWDFFFKGQASIFFEPLNESTTNGVPRVLDARTASPWLYLYTITAAPSLCQCEWHTHTYTNIPFGTYLLVYLPMNSSMYGYSYRCLSVLYLLRQVSYMSPARRTMSHGLPLERQHLQSAKALWAIKHLVISIFLSSCIVYLSYLRLKSEFEPWNPPFVGWHINHLSFGAAARSECVTCRNPGGEPWGSANHGQQHQTSTFPWICIYDILWIYYGYIM